MKKITRALIESSRSLTDRLTTLHTKLIETVPGVDRIACALYDPQEDTLKTFINSTHNGNTLVGYEYPLSDSYSLKALADSGEFRVLDEISSAVCSDSVHSTWLKDQGYLSSFTVPIYDEGGLLGFVFFDSNQPATFNVKVQRDLVLYTSLIRMSITSEISAIRMAIETTRVVRQLTQMRDFETGAHLERMGRYSHIIARAVAKSRGLSDEFVESVCLFTPLHDVGKIAIPDRILLKPGRLDADERAIMETHVEKGMEIIERMMGKGRINAFPESSILRNIVLCHHEFLDGTGYPRGLVGDEVPLEARIVSVADIFDALTSQRPYKKQWSLDEAFAELSLLADQGKLDNDCVMALIEQTETVQHVMTTYIDGDV